MVLALCSGYVGFLPEESIFSVDYGSFQIFAGKAYRSATLRFLQLPACDEDQSLCEHLNHKDK